MSVVSARIATPLPGKSELTVSRAKALAAIIQKAAGGIAKVYRVGYGEGADDVHLYASFKDFSHASKSVTAMTQDPEYSAWAKTRESDPSSHLKGPEVFRTAFGKLADKPVILQREFVASRANVPHLLALLPELQAMMGDGVPVVAVLPIVASHMDRVGLAYYFDSAEHVGEMLDRVGMSPSFQDLTIKAGQFGTLKHARLLMQVA